MPAEQRALTSGVLSKMGGRGDCVAPIQVLTAGDEESAPFFRFCNPILVWCGSLPQSHQFPRAYRLSTEKLRSLFLQRTATHTLSRQVPHAGGVRRSRGQRLLHSRRAASSQDPSL